VPYSADEMFDLVADVERYPEFIPHCIDLRIDSNDAVNGVLVADMVVGYRAFRERFRSRVELDRPNFRITAEYIEGPFRHLRTLWRFADTEEGSEVDFIVEFEFRSFVLQAAAAVVFERVFAHMSDAFVKRAADVYA